MMPLSLNLYQYNLHQLKTNAFYGFEIYCHNIDNQLAYIEQKDNIFVRKQIVKRLYQDKHMKP